MLLAAVNQMTEPMSIGSPMLYAVFFAIVAILLLVDFFTFKTPKNGEAVSMKQAGIWSAIWVGVSMVVSITKFWRCYRHSKSRGVFYRIFTGKIARH